ncbi:MAG TPA: acetate/propionate family kinase [Thermoanaerobaculia bacterium]|nr:acetate/propionate family kinase [Thermoanaerobaculia bacterium]
MRAVGHRVVHGGTLYRESVVIDEQVVTALAGLSSLAPLHNPPAIAAIRRARELLPNVPHVAVFDTAFFAKLPPRSHVYPLPYEWHTDWGVRRFGFHGISHAYCAERARELLSGARDLRVVVCHLGQGCSASAVLGGRARATTMGFTPMEGLMMASRSGSVDPGILIHALRRGVGVEDLDVALNRRSGLLGVSGVSSDYREVEASAKGGNERARLALDMYADRVRETVGALATALGGIDALVFTAGVGENSASLRAAVCERLEFLGLRLDRTMNEVAEPDCDVAAAESQGRILVIRTRENLMIAREARRVAASSIVA